MEKLLDVSLCMIVKDEEKCLARCLNSIKDIVGEIIIVDTGSKDKTIEIAKRYGARIEHFQWENDFSAARNYSLKFATKKWILLMDADDEFNESDKEKFINLLNTSEKDGHFFITMSYSGTGNKEMTLNQNIRLIRNKKGYLFEGKIHEQIINVNKKINYTNFSMEDLKVFHYGYLDEVIKEKHKRNRNLQIIKEELANDPTNKFHKYNLAVELFSLGKYKQSLELLNEVYSNLDYRLGYAPKTVLKRILCMYELAYYEDALKEIADGLIIYPSFTDLEYFRGLILLKLKRYTLAIDSFNMCLLMGTPPLSLAVIKGCEDFKAYEKLGGIYEILEDYTRAVKAYEFCLKIKPDDYSYLCKISHLILKGNHDLKIAKQKIESYFKEDNFFKNKLLAFIYIEEGFYELAFEYLQKSKEIKSDSQVEFLFGKYYFYKKNMKKAYEVFNKLIVNPEDNLDCARYMFIIDIINKEYLKAMEDMTKIIDNAPYKKLYFNLLNIIQTNILNDNITNEELNEILNLINELLIINEYKIVEKLVSLIENLKKINIHLKLAILFDKRNDNKKAFEQVKKSLNTFDEVDENALLILNNYIKNK